MIYRFIKRPEQNGVLNFINEQQSPLNIGAIEQNLPLNGFEHGIEGVGAVVEGGPILDRAAIGVVERPEKRDGIGFQLLASEPDIVLSQKIQDFGIVDGETQSFESRGGQFLCVYTDNLLSEEKRAAGISGINRGVGLNK